MPKEREPGTSSGQESGPEQANGPNPLDFARDVADRYRKGPTSGPQRRWRSPGPVAPRQRSSRDEPIAVSQALTELIAQQGWQGRLDAQRIFTDWAAIVGPNTAEHSHVTRFDNAVVTVQASSTAWAKELKLLAPRIVARLNELLGDGSVVRVEVLGPQAPSWKSGPYSVKGRGPRDTYG